MLLSLLWLFALYLIEILHQTTTPAVVTNNLQRCILSKFYIKPQQWRRLPRCCCVVSYRNSTSNHNGVNATMSGGSVVSYRNSTSNHNEPGTAPAKQLVVSYRNSTSNHNGCGSGTDVYSVVSYRNSTSNHNNLSNASSLNVVVSYRNSTSNHNRVTIYHLFSALYLIEILHQTTT